MTIKNKKKSFAYFPNKIVIKYLFYIYIYIKNIIRDIVDDIIIINSI